MQDAIGQRRRNQIRASHLNGADNLVCVQPLSDIRRIVRDRHSELPHTPQIGDGKIERQ